MSFVVLLNALFLYQFIFCFSLNFVLVRIFYSSFFVVHIPFYEELILSTTWIRLTAF